MKSAWRFLLSTLFLALALPLSVLADPMWSEVGVRAPVSLAKDTAGVLYASSSFGFYKSTDQGDTWQNLNVDESFHHGFAVMVNPITNDVFLATEPGVYRSDDGGASWTKMTDDIVGTYGMAARSDGLLVASGSPGTWFSSDNGDTWVEKHATLGPLQNGIAFSDASIFVTSVTGEIYRSQDDGATWQDITGMLGDPEINSAMDVVTDTVKGYVYVTAFHQFFQTPTYNKILRSSDDGDTWVQLDSVGGIALAIGIDGQGHVYTSRNPISYSTDHGATWTEITDGIDGTPHMLDFLEATPGRMLLANNSDSLLIADFGPPPPCCEGAKGNISLTPDCGDNSGIADVGDLTNLISHLFISFNAICCIEEADLTNDDEVDIGDLSALIDHLFISFGALNACN